MFSTIIIFILILGILIFVHEFGHFIVAKKNGVKVEEFGFGFPPRIFGVKRGETVYSINAIPLGGFVRALGEDGSETNNPRSFAAKKVWQRALILVAGVAMNFLFAVILVGIGYMIGLPVAAVDNAKGGDVRVQITDVSTNSPAAQAGIVAGDIIRRLNNEPIIHVGDFQSKIQSSLESEVILTVLRGDKELSFDLIPRANPPSGEGAVGVGLVETTIARFPWYQALWEGLKSVYYLTVASFVAIAMILKNLIINGQVNADVAGPVGIAVITQQRVQLGFIYLLQFTAMLSLNLAIINLLPFPALDGGRLLFLLIEKIKGSPVSQRIEQAIHATGFVLLILLMVLITVRDISRFF